MHAPAHLAPGRVDTRASQIDVAPTVLGLLRLPYRSRFFGHDILRVGQLRSGDPPAAHAASRWAYR